MGKWIVVYSFLALLLVTNIVQTVYVCQLRSDIHSINHNLEPNTKQWADETWNKISSDAEKNLK